MLDLPRALVVEKIIAYKVLSTTGGSPNPGPINKIPELGSGGGSWLQVVWSELRDGLVECRSAEVPRERGRGRGRGRATARLGIPV